MQKYHRFFFTHVWKIFKEFSTQKSAVYRIYKFKYYSTNLITFLRSSLIFKFCISFDPTLTVKKLIRPIYKGICAWIYTIILFLVIEIQTNLTSIMGG